jgi:hypothetical protein
VVGAPDYATAFVGWRCWLVVLVESEYRLCSPVYPTIWAPGNKTEAICCQQHMLTGRRRPAGHRAPHEHCRCGIYASDTPQPPATLVNRIDRAVYGYPVAQPVLGRVSLWGQVVECEHGWRAACAYPADLYVPIVSEHTQPVPTQPAAPRKRLAWLAHLFNTAPPQASRPSSRSWSDQTPHAAQIARALERYNVPVYLLPCQTLHQAVNQLAHQLQTW